MVDFFIIKMHKKNLRLVIFSYLAVIFTPTLERGTTILLTILNN
jgi:hypothetical protein